MSWFPVNIQEKPQQVIMSISSPNGPEPNSIVLNCANEEHLKITKTGFWVRGKLVEQDDKEAELVYNAFKEFLVYHNLTRDY